MDKYGETLIFRRVEYRNRNDNLLVARVEQLSEHLAVNKSTTKNKSRDLIIAALIFLEKHDLFASKILAGFKFS